MKQKILGADQRFGRLTTVASVILPQRHIHAWICKCDCGTETIVFNSNLASGKTQSCGCLRRTNKVVLKKMIMPIIWRIKETATVEGIKVSDINEWTKYLMTFISEYIDYI